MMSIMPRFSSRCIRSISFSTLAWTVTSSAVVGSSAISNRGFEARAIAIIARCREILLHDADGDSEVGVQSGRHRCHGGSLERNVAIGLCAARTLMAAPQSFLVRTRPARPFRDTPRSQARGGLEDRPQGRRPRRRLGSALTGMGETMRDAERRIRLGWLLMALTAGMISADTLDHGLPGGPGALVEDREGHFWIAAGGADGVVLRSDTGGRPPWTVVAEGRVGGLQVAADGDIWMAVGDDVLRVPRGTLQPVARTASFVVDGAPGALLATRTGDVWCAGCAARRRGDGLFEAVPLGPDGYRLTPLLDDAFGNLWAAIETEGQRDLAVLTAARPHGWQRLGLAADQLAGPWVGAVADDA
ncbi:MAG: hypothetical protein O3A02_05795, partial [bacterium]|nr:hypothetical protein [bacterium]